MKKLKKAAICTDIHFGKKTNSPQHNEDCLSYLNWFCDQVRSDPSIDHILFLGDWHENRSSLNVGTLHASYIGARKLNELNMPVYFCVGNHDLFHRHTREIHSTVPFHEFSNFIVVNDPVVVKEIADGALLSPYLFPEEYPDLKKLLTIPFWAGHFEFKGFVVTGYNVLMPTGPDPSEYAGPEHILCGHFHKRQTAGNITYVGNTFPMDFGDAGDFKRGLATIDHMTSKLSFIDWPDCPKYIKATLSDLLDNSVILAPNARIKCIADVPISYEESSYLRQKYSDDYNLREFTIEESKEIDSTLTDTQVKGDITGLDSVDDLVIKMLLDIKSDHIDSDMLISIFRKIKL